MERKIPEKLKYNKKDVYEEIIKWLEENNGKFPRSIIRKNGNTLKREEIQKLKSLQQARKNKDIEITNRMKKALLTRTHCKKQCFLVLSMLSMGDVSIDNH